MLVGNNSSKESKIATYHFSAPKIKIPYTLPSFSKTPKIQKVIMISNQPLLYFSNH